MICFDSGEDEMILKMFFFKWKENGEKILHIVYKTKKISIAEEYCQMKVCKNHH